MKLTFLTVSSAVFVLQLIAVFADAEKNLRGEVAHRQLEDYDDAYYLTDDDDAMTNSTGTTFQNMADGTKQYFTNHAQTGYTNVPSEWDAEEWFFIGLVMFLFGSMSSICCLLCVFPKCCPHTMRTAYARFIAPDIEDGKKVRLIKK